IQLAVTRPVSSSSTAAGLRFFSDCEGALTGTYIAGQGVYLLTIAPAETREGRAMTSGLGNEAASCNTDTIVEGVQFRLVQIDSLLEDGTLAAGRLIRSRIAEQFFGLTPQMGFNADPLGGLPATFNLMEVLRSGPVSDCEVPLAVLYSTLS